MYENTLSEQECIQKKQLASLRMPDRNAIKLFVGQIPHDITEGELRLIFDKYGDIFEITILKDKLNKKPKGCCFIQYYTRLASDTAQRTLHNQLILAPNKYPIQVKKVDMAPDRSERKLFVGMLAHSVGETELRERFEVFGEIEDCTVLKTQYGIQSFF